MSAPHTVLSISGHATFVAERLLEHTRRINRVKKTNIMMTTSRGCAERTRQAGWKNVPRRGQVLAAPAPKRGRAVSAPAPKAQEAWPKKKRLRAGSAVEGELVEKYVPLVKAVVARLSMTLPPHVDGEDLYSAGLTGLLRAVRQYNPLAGTSFETYARVRIRGAVFDELRRMDWVPRSVHTKARKVQAAMQGVEQAKGRAPTDEEMAKALNIPLSEYQEWVEEIRPASFICLDANYNNETDDSISQYESLPDQRQETPMDGAFRREIAGLIATRLKQLPEMQRKVLALYYFEDMRLREIADIFGLTESRICQIHAQGIMAIKSYLQKYDPYFV